MPELVHRGVGNEGRVARFGHPLVAQLRVVDVREPVDEGLQPETVGILAVPVLDLAAQQRPDGRLQHRPGLSELASARQCHLLAPIVRCAGRRPSPKCDRSAARLQLAPVAGAADLYAPLAIAASIAPGAGANAITRIT